MGILRLHGGILLGFSYSFDVRRCLHNTVGVVVLAVSM